MPEVKVSQNGPERRSGKRIIAGTAFRLEFLVGWYYDADRWRNNGGTCTLLETAFTSYFPSKISYEFKANHFRLYVRFKGTCSLPSQALLNTGE